MLGLKGASKVVKCGSIGANDEAGIVSFHDTDEHGSFECRI